VLTSLIIKRVFVGLALVLAQITCAFGAEETIVVVGDSLSSGYGLSTEQSWVAILADRLDEQAYGYEVVNASIAGDTSSGGLARLPRLLEAHDPAVVIIELGGNDGLRGLPVSRLKDNLSRMIELVLEDGSTPVLAGIQIPPNYGPTYTEQFTAAYRDLAMEHDIPFVEFLMEGVALKPELMQSDRIHPNEAGQVPMLENVWRVLMNLL
jgi:acyl-CoA thioesterase-1